MFFSPESLEQPILVDNGKDKESIQERKKIDLKKEKIKKKTPKENDQKLLIEKKKKEKRDVSLIDLDDTDKIQKIAERYKILKEIFDKKPLQGRIEINENIYKEFEIISVTIDLKNFTFRFNNSIFSSATKFIQYLFTEYTNSAAIAKPWDQIEVNISEDDKLCQYLNLNKKEDPKWISLGSLIPTEYRRKNKKQKKNQKSPLHTADVTEIKFLTQQQSALMDDNHFKKKNPNDSQDSFFQKNHSSSPLVLPITNHIHDNQTTIQKNPSIQQEKAENIFNEKTHLIGKIVSLVIRLETNDLQDIADSLEKLLSDRTDPSINHLIINTIHKPNPINSVLIQKNQIMCQDFSEEENQVSLSKKEEKSIPIKGSFAPSDPLKGLLNPSFRTAN